MDEMNEMDLRLSLSSDEEPLMTKYLRYKAATAASTLADGNVTVRKRSMFVLSL